MNISIGLPSGRALRRNPYKAREGLDTGKVPVPVEEHQDSAESCRSWNPLSGRHSRLSHATPRDDRMRTKGGVDAPKYCAYGGVYHPIAAPAFCPSIAGKLLKLLMPADLQLSGLKFSCFASSELLPELLHLRARPMGPVTMCVCLPGIRPSPGKHLVRH